MKCPSSHHAAGNRSAKGAYVEPLLKPSPIKEPSLRSSPVKQHDVLKPHSPTAAEVTAPPPCLNSTRAAHNKENSVVNVEHHGSLNEALEDSGYLSLHSSQIHGDADDSTGGAQELQPVTPALCRKTRPAHPLCSTPALQEADANLPILKFQRAVCQQLAMSFEKTKRYDWSVVSRLANEHLLDRVIGGQMGRDYVDVLASLLSRNMRTILTRILGLLSDADLISCKKVSRTWKQILCDDSNALSRTQTAESRIREAATKQKAGGLTRDSSLSRVVLSCVQTLATTSSGRTRQQPTRFSEYLQTASGLKQNESLCSCKLCGSPSKVCAGAQRATCTRLSCRFDFCTRCKEDFHGSTPCRSVPSKAPLILPRRTHSKRNLRRL